MPESKARSILERDIQIRSLNVFRNNLERNGIVIRIEDKLHGVVLCSREWEARQIERLIHKEVLFEKIPSKVRLPYKYQIPKMYFNPKTHKGEPITGRPIVSWRNSLLPDELKLRNTIKLEFTTAFPEFTALLSIDESKIIQGMQLTKDNVRKGYTIKICDVNEMFTSICRKEFCDINIVPKTENCETLTGIP